MKTHQVVEIILNTIISLLFLATGIIVLVLRGKTESYDTIILGNVLILVGISRGIIYIANQGYKNIRNISFISSLGLIALGIISLVSNRDIEILCFGWGTMELVLGVVELYINLLEVKEDKLVIAEMVINLGTIVFAILLCVRQSSGLTGHLIFLGISLILLGTLHTFKFIRSMKGKKND